MPKTNSHRGTGSRKAALHRLRRQIHVHSDVTDMVGPGGKALTVDTDIKTANLNRLRRIEGQIRGLAGMVEQNRYCADILIQIAAVQKSLDSIARQLLDNHIRHCITSALMAGGVQADAARHELLKLVSHINH